MHRLNFNVSIPYCNLGCFSSLPATPLIGFSLPVVLGMCPLTCRLASQASRPASDPSPSVELELAEIKAMLSEYMKTPRSGDKTPLGEGQWP